MARKSLAAGDWKPVSWLPLWLWVNLHVKQYVNQTLSQDYVAIFSPAFKPTYPMDGTFRSWAMSKVASGKHVYMTSASTRESLRQALGLHTNLNPMRAVIDYAYAYANPSSAGTFSSLIL